MTSSELIPAAVLNRKAVVYVRQSTQSQIMTDKCSTLPLEKVGDVFGRLDAADLGRVDRHSPASRVSSENG